MLERLVGSMQGQVWVPSDRLALPVRLFDHHSFIKYRRDNQPVGMREFESAVFIIVLNNENVKGKDPSLRFGESCPMCVSKKETTRGAKIVTEKRFIAPTLQRPMS